MSEEIKKFMTSLVVRNISMRFYASMFIVFPTLMSTYPLQNLCGHFHFCATDHYDIVANWFSYAMFGICAA